jgi:hypothetical protein
MKQTTSRPFELSNVILICGATIGAMLAIRWMSVSKPVSLAHLVLMLPLFMCLVPLISSVFGDGLYRWSKYSMRFVPLDIETSPVLFRAQQVIYCVLAIVIAVLLFRF